MLAYPIGNICFILLLNIFWHIGFNYDSLLGIIFGENKGVNVSVTELIAREIE